MNFGAVPALQDLLHDAVPCAPTQKELKAFQNKFKANNDIEHSLHGNQTFYLHDDGALNFDKEIACVAKHFHVSTNSTGARAHLNWDVGGSTLEIMYAEHLGEVAILRDLRNHPMRTMDPMSAKIHILGFPTLLTWLAQGGRGGGNGGASPDMACSYIWARDTVLKVANCHKKSRRRSAEEIRVVSARCFFTRVHPLAHRDTRGVRVIVWKEQRPGFSWNVRPKIYGT